VIDLADDLKVTRRSLLKPVQPNGAQARPGLSFLSLPPEIRRMILNEYWKSLAGPESGQMSVTRPDDYYKKTMPYTLWLASRQRCKAIFLVSKQVSNEAKDSFWTTTAFYIRYLNDLVHFLNMKQNVAGRRPPLFPSHLIRDLSINFSWSTERDYRHALHGRGKQVYIIECLWTLVRCTNNSLELKVERPGVLAPRGQLYYGYDESTDTFFWPDIVRELRAYRARLKEAGMPLRITRAEMESWIADGPKLALNLPAIPSPKAAVETYESV
jgi:hypothetical protein